MRIDKKSVKSVVTLTLLAVIFSAILTILNFVLYVSPEERTMRAIKKIYGECIGEIEGRLNKLLDERREQCADARKQADRAQEGLNFTPKPVDVKVLCDYVYGKDKTDKEVIDK